jgi:hypothetical protein
MVSHPDRSSSAGGPASRQAAARAGAAAVQPARYVHGLLLGQGLAWLVLAVTGLVAWVAAFPHNLILGGGAAFFRASLELLAIAVAGCIGSAEVGMACRMRGGPRLVVAMTGSLQGTMFALALILAAVLIMVGGSMLELMALGGLPGLRCHGC